MQKLVRKNLLHQEAVEALKNLSDSQLMQLQFSFPWQNSALEEAVDVDGFSVGDRSKRDDRESIQNECWEKWKRNPHVSTSIRGLVGRLTGFGFGAYSDIFEIQEVLTELERDRRNKLWSYWPKYVGRAFVEGELFLPVTLHSDGFVEVDFVDPSNIKGGGKDGVIYHPRKSTMPMYYFVNLEDTNGIGLSETVVMPSIELAWLPNLAKDIKETEFKGNKVVGKTADKRFKKLNGYSQFMICWDRSLITRRNTSYLRTVIEWLNHYELLKKYEIDHKRASGNFLWVITMNDPQSFRLWLGLSDEERRKTGIMAKKTPGGTLVLPPGFSLEARNPNLPRISEGDTDIFHMVSAGLNEPEDILSGQSKGTFASVKATRGPMSDRTSDEVASFRNFMLFDFFASVFYLRSQVTDFPREFKVREAVGFNKKKEAIHKSVMHPPEDLVEINFPTSEVIDAESRAKAFLGVKHGSVIDTLGIPASEIAKKLGFHNYRKLRLMQETEKDRYPELISNIDAESVQEQKEAEPSPSKAKGNKESEEDGEE